MKSFRLKVSYNGHLYFGWQIQNGSELRTIQGEINKALKKIVGSEEIKSIGSGRTDARVHALGQIVKVDIPLDIEEVALRRALNSLLPSVIKVLSCEVCSDDFHPIFHAQSKEYRYYFTVGRDESAFQKQFVTHLRSGELDFNLMEKACEEFIGECDFQNYFCLGTPVKSTVRTIFECEIVRESGFLSPLCDDVYCMRIRGSGFLKQMVRLIMGAIWEVGKGKASLEDLKSSLREPKKAHLGAVAPAEGLYLFKVHY